MSDIVDAVKQLAIYHVKAPALIVKTTEGGYVISPDGPTGGTGRPVISRSQLGTLMWENGFSRNELADPQAAAKVAALVASFSQPGCPGGKA